MGIAAIAHLLTRPRQGRADGAQRKARDLADLTVTAGLEMMEAHEARLLGGKVDEQRLHLLSAGTAVFGKPDYTAAIAAIRGG